ncbi:helix-turn-helix domain-containing protein [Clostridium botulinum]|uniref:helix-turn-helix domain-containing protein n=1 Tax=Clostridium botulinum TaxID=1491 RepID=UPI00064C8039|nr:helix-turn-helix transcriptional regulator [Clostridium botulinum]KLU74225.1 transcriptional regulator [Clostridium botulinum V891]MCD3202843.1 helix-turn-helix transcriptional regulator [Clostridium botulinum C/D]MCD3230869.1 helix-turn-helix transcriptional regulator [Clostridium botulinum C/D]MCD3253945.1 helix-turn-helix transcriptional regulator [Clostridium botulinum C/D]MCD3279459.1 helix-turn-helix transcriptional regulator [Clostridium botulinum C/D]
MYKIEFLLKNLRNKKNLTQKELARRCNLSQAYLSLLETNSRSPKLITIEKIANVLEVDPFEFIIKKRI